MNVVWALGGIAIVGALGVLVRLGLSWWLWRRRRVVGRAESGVLGFLRDDLRRFAPFAVAGIVLAGLAILITVIHR